MAAAKWTVLVSSPFMSRRDSYLLRGCGPGYNPTLTAHKVVSNKVMTWRSAESKRAKLADVSH